MNNKLTINIFSFVTTNFFNNYCFSGIFIKIYRIYKLVKYKNNIIFFVSYRLHLDNNFYTNNNGNPICKMILTAYYFSIQYKV